MPNQILITIDTGQMCYAAARIELETSYFRSILIRSRYNRAAAARRAGIPYSTFCRRLANLNIEGA